MNKIIVTIAILAATPIFAGNWTRQDTLMEAAVIGAMIADWNQTRQIAADPAPSEGGGLFPEFT